LDSGKIRAFTASDVDFAVYANRVCLDFNEKFYASHVPGTWSFVGLSKYHGGFERVHDHLAEHPNGYELDESEYDASLPIRMLESVRDFRKECLCEDARADGAGVALDYVYRQIIHSTMVMPDGHVFQKHGGNPSGSVNTIVDNTLILFHLLAYAFIVLWRRQNGHVYLADGSSRSEASGEYPTYEYYMENVRAVLCGDDNSLTVSHKVNDWFNVKTVVSVWEEIGIHGKTPCEEPRKALDLEFVSAGFRHVTFRGETRILPVVELEKALSSVVWGAGCPDPRYQMERILALRIETWADEKARAIFNRLMDEWKRENMHLLVRGGDYQAGKARHTMDDIAGLWKTDKEIWDIYTSSFQYEACGSVELFRLTTWGNGYPRAERAIRA